ncbi:DNA repair helicase RAD5,16, SNF2 family helicase [Histoplasma ohiense]|nr:DNA repair helicase RAD5,16, SNF2 family helicase [Histoplasma ohiense (nom. inval.)]
MQNLVNGFVDALKSPCGEQNESQECIKCHREPTSVLLTSCLHIYCQDCASEAVIQAGSVCDCGAAVDQTVSCKSLESFITSATPQLEGNPVGMVNSHKKSRKKTDTKGSEVESSNEDMNWVACVGHLMPGAKLTAISSCLVNWFKNSVETKVVVFTQFLGMAQAHVLGSMCQENRWGHLSVSLHGHYRRNSLAKCRFDNARKASKNFLKTRQSAFWYALSEQRVLGLTLQLQINAFWLTSGGMKPSSNKYVCTVHT